ncbi:MAG: hypothetical protein IPQ07_17905 [Myxococcales bacterium]|nr:hypothetical protein [Myxococcales bacterium]
MVAVDRALLTTDVDAAIRRPDVDIVCELMGGTTLAKDAVLSATIAAKRHVVTANKALLAEHWGEVFGAAERAGVDVYYEAAVCGGVPIIHVLREGPRVGSRGIDHPASSTAASSYILSTMTGAGARSRTSSRRRKPSDTPRRIPRSMWVAAMPRTSSRSW